MSLKNTFDKPSAFEKAYRKISPGGRYNITSSDKYHYTWFRVAKNGTRTLLSILLEGAPPEINAYDLKYRSKHYKDNFKFAIIRNPWDRLVSAYAEKVERKKLFPECWDKDFYFFIKRFISKTDLRRCDKHIRLQTTLFPARDLDHLGKFENLSNEMDFLCSKIGIESENVHRNKSKRRHYSEYYNDETRRIVAELFRDDIELGNYTFGIEK